MVPVPYPTIQSAINDPTCTTIMVAAGTYPEGPGPLNVFRTVTLNGAQAGMDARNPRGMESVITDPQGTIVRASNVVIDGFTIQNSAVATFTGYGVDLAPGIGGTQILNNIIQNNIVGIGLANLMIPALIRHNLIRTNNLPGGSSGTGIYTDEFVGGSVVRDVRIVENTFTGNVDAGIDSSNTDPAGGVFSVEVANNTFDANGRAVVLFNTHNWSIHDNTISNNTFAASAAVRIFDNNTNMSILNNNLTNGLGHAVRLSFFGFVGGPSSGVVLHENNIGTVGPASFAGDGLLVDPGSHVGTVNAECNWWGSASGPINVNNVGGTGEEVVGDADFTPWLTAPAPGGSCFGGIPSTPGKVTGGGQISGDDPLFSPTGDLISLPAITLSAMNSNGKATFGLSVKCCPASGNLEYNDHDADVRIKAQSFDSLHISSPGLTCPTVLGSKHADMTGTADVTRSTGTVPESLTVNVDDCGEPGTSDNFHIKTDTYENGPATLIGGNIQIH